MFTNRFSVVRPDGLQFTALCEIRPGPVGIERFVLEYSGCPQSIDLGSHVNYFSVPPGVEVPVTIKDGAGNVVFSAILPAHARPSAESVSLL